MSTLAGPGAIGFAGNTSDFYTTPYPHKPGDKGRDKDGNEYLFVDYSVGPVYYGVIVGIAADNTAAPLLGTARIPLRVGIAMGGVATSASGMTSDHGGWVQVYGLHVAAQTGWTSSGLSSDGTVEYFAVPQTSVGSPTGTFSLITQAAGSSIAGTSTDNSRIWGLWVLDPAQVSNLTPFPTAAAFGASVSDTSGPTSVGLNAGVAAGTATSAFIGQTAIVFLNYPWIDGNSNFLGAVTT